jgi:hypothetical protein
MLCFFSSFLSLTPFFISLLLHSVFLSFLFIPGRIKAGSSVSIRFVAINTLTSPRGSKPSNWFRSSNIVLCEIRLARILSANGYLSFSLLLRSSRSLIIPSSPSYSPFFPILLSLLPHLTLPFSPSHSPFPILSTNLNLTLTTRCRIITFSADSINFINKNNRRS